MSCVANLFPPPLGLESFQPPLECDILQALPLFLAFRSNGEKTALSADLSRRRQCGRLEVKAMKVGLLDDGGGMGDEGYLVDALFFCFSFLVY